MAVHWAVGVRCPPYSRGVRYCRSAEQKCEEAVTAAHSPKPPSKVIEARASPSPIVEQAPYRPKKGTSCPRAAKEEPMHWLSRSPAKSQSRAEAACPALFSARPRACFCMALSDFSQVDSPKVSSVSI